MSLITTFKAGQRYMRLCPQDRELAYSFRELKIINYIKFATKYLPPIVVALLVLQYYVHTQLAVTTITVLFALSLPIQGIFWLGKRAQSPLPLNLVDWFNRIKQQLVEINILSEKKNTAETLTFEEFMKLLILAKQHFGSYSGRNDDTPPPLTKI